MLKKSGIRSIIASLLCIIITLTSFPAISHAKPEDSQYKPVIKVGHVVVPPETGGKQVYVAVKLTGECVYSKVRLKIRWDSRLVLVKQGGNSVEAGTAVREMNVTATESGINGLIFEANPKSSSSGNCGHTGTLFSMAFSIPNNAGNGDFFPVEIENYSQSGNYDAVLIDKDGLYTDMQDWVFTTGSKGIWQGGIQVESSANNHFDKQDNKEVLYYTDDGISNWKTHWNQPKTWSSYVDPDTYTGDAKVWFDKVEVPFSSASGGKAFNVKLNVSGAAGKVSLIGFHIYYDTRLTPAGNPNGKYITAGSAISDFNVSETVPGNGRLNLVASASGNKLKDGVIGTITFKVPSTVKAGDLYPIGIQYYYDGSTSDQFYNSYQNSEGKLLMAHIFNDGIENGYISINDSDPKSGTTGDCTWNYNESTKTLTISGNGAMADYQANNTSNVAPWRYLYNDIEVLRIESGVTHIGNYAFDSLIKVPQVIIPDSVKSIGSCAFLWCYALASVKIGSGVESIGSGAFMCGRSAVAPAEQPLKEIEIPATVTSIGKKAFGYMYSSSTSSYKKNDELVIKGECGSAAKGYAIDVDNNFIFLSTRHYFTEVVHEQDASCTEIGITRTYCSCGDCETELADALGHDWGEPVYKWTDDHSEVIASVICKRDPSHVESETVSAALTEEVSPTVENDGKKVYTSDVFTNPLFTSQKLELPIAKLAPSPVPGSKASPVPVLTQPSGAQTPGTQATPDPNAVKEGLINDKYGSTYEIRIDSKGSPYAVFVISLADSAKKLTIPDSIKVSGKDVPVTEIAPKALKNHKKLVKVTIGKNVRKIGREAFFGCKNLKTIIFKTTKLKKKTVGKKAFGKIHEKAVAKVPKKQLKSYRKILKKRGMNGKKQKIKQ